jgi:UDP-N-acetylglucosamine 4-epimerase
LELANLLKDYLSAFDPKIQDVSIKHTNFRKGDIPHSLASIDKAKQLLNYKPEYDIKKGLEHAINWYWENLR